MWNPGPAHESADLHEGLVPQPTPVPRHETIGDRLGSGRREPLTDDGTGDDPGHVHVHHGVIGLVGEDENGTGGVGTDARKGAESGQVAGDHAAVPVGDQGGRGMEVPGPAVVSEAGPGPQDVPQGGCRTGSDRRKAVEKLTIGLEDAGR